MSESELNKNDLEALLDDAIQDFGDIKKCETLDGEQLGRMDLITGEWKIQSKYTAM